MSKSTQFLNGQWVTSVELVLDVEDIGVMLGATVSERLRTFSGQIFRCEDHLKRLRHSLEIIGVAADPVYKQIREVLPEVVARNGRTIHADDDLSIVLFVTPGGSPTGVKPTVCVYARPLAFDDWVDKYQYGERLIISRVRQVPANSWPPELKCRSRMHYYLADQEACERDPLARALLLDARGFVCESSTANVMVVLNGEISSPRLEAILPGVSLTTVHELAEQLNIRFTYRDITPDEVTAADEVLLTSTSSCLLPVTSYNSQPIGEGLPGKIFQRLLAAWSTKVGVEIAEQARRFSDRPVH